MLRKQKCLGLISKQACEHLKFISPFDEAEGSTVVRHKEVMIGRDAGFANKEPAAPDKLVIPVNPNIEVLECLISRECNVHALNDAASY